MEEYLSARTGRISLMKASCVSQLIKAASFPLRPYKKSHWNISCYRLLCMEAEVTSCILLIAFLLQENITGCLCVVSWNGREKYQLDLLVLHFRQLDNCNVLTFFPNGLFRWCQRQSFSKNYLFMASIYDQSFHLQRETISIICIAGALWSSCQKPRVIK